MIHGIELTQQNYRFLAPSSYYSKHMKLTKERIKNKKKIIDVRIKLVLNGIVFSERMNHLNI